MKSKSSGNSSLNKTWQVITTLLLLFVFLTITTHLRLWQSFDWDSLAAIQNALPRLFDVPFSLLTLLGSAEATGVIFLAIVLCAPANQRLPLILTFGLATLIEFVGKTYIDQPTTPRYLVRYVPFFKLALSEKVTAEFSFPSGHALRSIFIVIVQIKMISSSHWQRNTQYTFYAVLVVFEMVMLVSRVYLAEHWTTDVVAGAMLGAAFALIALEWKISLPKPLSRKLF